MYNYKDWDSIMSTVLKRNNIHNEQDAKELKEIIRKIIEIKETISERQNQKQLLQNQEFNAKEALSSLNDALVATILFYSNESNVLVPTIQNNQIVSYQMKIAEKRDIIADLELLNGIK